LLGLPILMYHEVTPRPSTDFHFYSVTPERFARQMRWLAWAGYSAVSLDLLAERLASGAPLPPRSVAITFDDGLKSCVEHAIPHLESYGFSATFFVVAGLVGGTSRWLRTSLGRELALADWDALRRLTDRGFTCGAHSMSHAHLTELSCDACRFELTESKRVLEDRLERPVVHMAYPYGEYNAEVVTLAQEAGYRTACAVRGGFAGVDDELLALRRIAVAGSDSLVDFACRVSTARFPGQYLRDTARAAWTRARGLRNAGP